MLEILLNHYELIISVISFVLAIVLLIIKKKPVNDLESVIFRLCVLAIIDTENAGILGADAKLKYCLDTVKEQLLSRFPNLEITRYEKLIISFIEFILCTPQKKEVK